MGRSLDPPFDARPERGQSRAARRSVTVGLVVGLPVSALLLWLAVRKADLSTVWDTLADARPGLVVVAVAAMAAVYVLQAERWRRIARVPRVRRVRFVEMVVGGVACNNVLPGRLGDLLRARWLGAESSLSAGRSVATVVVDRGFDLLALVVFLVVSLPFVTEEAWLGRIVAGGVAALALLGAVVLFAHAYTRRRVRERRPQRRVLRRLARDLAEGLARTLDLRVLAPAGALSLAVWGTWALGAWLVARAVGVELSPLETVFVAGAVNLGVAIPSSPGFVGTYQWLGVASLGLLDVARDDALAFAILMHAVWFVPTTAVGALLLARRGVRARRRTTAVRVSRPAGADHSSP